MKPDSQGSCGGNVSERRIARRKAISIHFSPPAVWMRGMFARTRHQAAKARAKMSSVTRTVRQCARSQWAREGAADEGSADGE